MNQDTLTLDIWHYTYDERLPLNLGTVERRLAQLRGHHRACV